MMAKELWLPTEDEIGKATTVKSYEPRIIKPLEGQERDRAIAKFTAKKIAERLSIILETSPTGKRLAYIENALQSLLKEIEGD